MKFSRTLFIQKLQAAYKKAAQDVNSRTNNTAEQKKEGWGRREFIATTALATAALAIPEFLYPLAAKQKRLEQKDTIAIIGGGIAGLNAANTLLKFGINATVYEASKRTGGRIFTETMANGLTRELGGEFVDTAHLDMFSLIEEFELEKMDCVKDINDNRLREHIFYFGKRNRSQAEIIAEFKKVTKIIDADYEKIGQGTAAALDKISLDSYLKNNLKLKGWFYDLLYWSFTAEYGLPAEEISSLNFIDMISTDTEEGFMIFGESDERFKIKGGNEMVIKKLSEKLNGQVKKEYKLTAIERSGNQYKLSFSNKEPVIADHVLLTLPFTMLRNVSIDAALNFPPEKMRLINEMEYATNSKLLLEVDKRIWRTRKDSGYLFNETIHNGWDNSQLQHNNSGAGGYTVFLGGKQGADLKEDAGNLQKYTPEFMNAFAVAKGGINFKADPKVFNWSKHEHTKGSYACYKTGQWLMFQNSTILEPVGNIYFAGEHCSKNFQGFMNGAAETGRIAAEKIVTNILKGYMK